MDVTTAIRVISRATRDIAALEQVSSMDRVRLGQLGLIEWMPLRRTYRVTLKGRNAVVNGWLDECSECGEVIVIVSTDQPSECPTCR